MTRLLALLSLVVLLSACDTTSPSPTAEISTSVTYSGTTLRAIDTQTRQPVFDYLGAGAQIGVVFTTDESFEATLVVPKEVLIASGETQDLDDIDQRVVGTYVQRDGELTFTQNLEEGWADTFFDAEGWTIASDGRSIRYSDSNGDRTLEVVLTRQ